MPPKNPELVASSSLIKNGLSKTQIVGLVTAVSGAVLVVMNVGETTDMNSVIGGCATVTLGGLTFLVGSIMRPDDKTDSISHDGERIFFGDDKEENNLTAEEATQIEDLFSESGGF